MCWTAEGCSSISAIPERWAFIGTLRARRFLRVVQWEMSGTWTTGLQKLII
jgi:hypothetical protein